MIPSSWPVKRSTRSRQRGITLIETMIASVVLVIGFVGTMSVFTVAVGRNSTDGDVGTRVTEYAQDKIEQLMALSYADSATNTAVYPAGSTGGTGLGGAMAGSQTIGSVSSSSQTAGYADYLDSSGNLLTSSSGAFFIRQWSITTNSSGTLKTITVVARATTVSRSMGISPSTTLVCMKSKMQ